jgi:hypothetical protein
VQNKIEKIWKTRKLWYGITPCSFVEIKCVGERENEIFKLIRENLGKSNE